jgi:DNA-binding NarL/FixJ family response regulator
MKKVLVADDHAVVREGIKRIIEETADMVVAGEAVNGWEVLDKARGGDYDVVVLDISMPGKNGMEILKELKRERPGVPVLILSMHPEEQYALRALRAGASGFVAKESAPDELIAALEKVLRGSKYITSTLAERLVLDIGVGSEESLHEKLSDRELQVLCLLAEGKTINQIGQELCLSAKTISTYRSRIMQKMAMKTNAQLIRYAIKNGLVD